MPRVRQFSAQRNELSKSRLGQSRKSGVLSNLNNSKVQKYQIATPTSKKRPSQTSNNNLSGSRISRNSSSSEYICTGCFNHQLASDKKEQRRNDLLRQKQQERYNTEVSKKNDHPNQGRLIREFMEMRDYNKKLIEERRSQKEKKQQTRQEQNKQQYAQFQNYRKEQRQRQEEIQRAKQKIRNEIKQEIDEKQRRLKLEKMNHSMTEKTDVFGKEEEIYFRQKTLKQQQYREDLLKQIKQRDEELKKQEIQKHNLLNIGIGITQAAYQRQVDRQRKLQQRQHQLLQEAKRTKKIKQAQFQSQKKLQSKIQQQRIQQERQKQALAKQYDKEKQQQIQGYLEELKQQIERQKIKRQKELNEDHRITQTSIELAERTVDRKTCKNCDKKLPKTFLTKIK